MHVHYVLHADFERPGLIEVWAAQAGFRQSASRPFAGETLPEVSQLDLLVVMGGPQSPLDVESSPYLTDEIALIRAARERSLPMLGFCLGAQLIGEAFGGRTERSPNREIGCFPIELTEAGTRDEIFRGVPARFPVMHWHNDMPGLAPGSTLLASSAGCPRQVVRYARNAYGFQCHPEMMRDNVDGMIRNCPGDLTPGTYVQTAMEMRATDLSATHAITRTILDNLLESRGLKS